MFKKKRVNLIDLVGLIIIIILCLYFFNYITHQKFLNVVTVNPVQNQNIPLKKININFYLPDKNCQNIIVSKVDVLASGFSLYEKLQAILTNYMQVNTWINFMPNQLNEIFINKNQLYINIDKSLIKENDSDKILVIINALVNTIVKNTSIKKVKFLINGEEENEVTKIMGNNFYTFDPTFLQKN